MIDELDTSMSERLDGWFEAEMPADQRGRYRPALDWAKQALEQTSPILGVATPRGPLIGIYSETTPGRLIVAVASATGAILFDPPLRAIGQAVADAELYLTGKGITWTEARGCVPSVIAAILKERAFSSPALGFLLGAEEHRTAIELYAKAGATPALIALLARGPQGVGPDRDCARSDLADAGARARGR